MAAAALVAHRLLRPVVIRLTRFSTILSAMARTCDRPVQLLLPLTALLVFWQGVPDDVRAIGSVQHVTGVAGLVVGLAARSVFGNLLAGLQIAMAQPIRIDDVLIVEGEWGRVEEITSTYVVLKIWDERRLIVPLQWFIEHPFQNWTRHGAELLGTVFLWVDYTLPLEPIRAETRRLCEASASPYH